MDANATTGGLVGRAQESPLLAVGCDFRTASTVFRETLLTTADERRALFEGIRRSDPDAGFMAVETCNRVEWVISTEQPAWVGELLLAQMLQRWHQRFGEGAELPSLVLHSGRAAAEHLFRVAAGLESLAQGEAEIAGQLQAALQRAQEEGTSTRVLNGLGRFVGGMARSAQRLGLRSSFHRGIHVLTAWFLERRLGAGSRHVGVAGMGEIGRKTADFIEQHLGWKVERLNRTVAGHEGRWRPLGDLPGLLPELEALVIATGARAPVFSAALLGPGPRAGRLLVVDLGIPGQVQPGARALPWLDLVPVDALAEVGHPAEDPARASLEIVVQQQVARFNRFCLERYVVGLLRRAQEKRLELVHGDVEGRLLRELPELDAATRGQVAELLRDVVRGYAHGVFESVHDALEEGWRNARDSE
ncbi:MAG: hypothetical protein FJ098_14565 [Deltaproteobacteria bacterium]|nr:hypothetical protein [Deltaproteobacteria bacterium]